MLTHTIFSSVFNITEKDPYPIDALPTCNHALNVCQQERKCIKLFEDFKTHCKVRENKCRMEDRLVRISISNVVWMHSRAQHHRSHNPSWRWDCNEASTYRFFVLYQEHQKRYNKFETDFQFQFDIHTLSTFHPIISNILSICGCVASLQSCYSLILILTLTHFIFFYFTETPAMKRGRTCDFRQCSDVFAQIITWNEDVIRYLML